LAANHRPTGTRPGWWRFRRRGPSATYQHLAAVTDASGNWAIVVDRGQNIVTPNRLIYLASASALPTSSVSFGGPKPTFDCDLQLTSSPVNFNRTETVNGVS
jgi:hypothetical protein